MRKITISVSALCVAVGFTACASHQHNSEQIPAGQSLVQLTGLTRPLPRHHLLPADVSGQPGSAANSPTSPGASRN